MFFALEVITTGFTELFITHSTSSNMAEKTKTGHIVTAFSVVSRQNSCDGCLKGSQTDQDLRGVKKAGQ